MTCPQYAIGIDLGTTNSTVAVALLPQSNQKNGSDRPEIMQMPIAQLVSAGCIEEKLMLPSFLYSLLDQEKKAATKLLLNENSSWIVGSYAKQRGCEVLDRMISSSKSWLCHSVIDRRSPFLPLNAVEDITKLSPIDASQHILEHIRNAFTTQYPQVDFTKQQVCITIPASFDPSARQLVEEAATQAGYGPILFLEEPQAAFYSWLWEHQDIWRDTLSVGQTILVIDIGGGTTDFTIIQATDNHGNLELVRQAVGSHLLLGGDNLDLALALLAKNKLEGLGHELDEWHMHHLIHSARQVKEKALECDLQAASFDCIIPGKGSKLIGKALKISLTREEIVTCLLDGFFPKVSYQEQSTLEKTSGIKQIGLNYARDPRITAQLAKFLSRTGESDSKSAQDFIIPDVVLFNGGTLKSKLFCTALVNALNDWAQELGKNCVKILEGADLDFSVSKGATAYLLARAGIGTRIRAGASRSYFIGVEDALPAIPGMEPPVKAVCVVPFGMEEGSSVQLNQQEFFLIVGEPVKFRFFSRSTPLLPNGDETLPGSCIRNVKNELYEHHPVESMIDQTQGDSKIIRVQLISQISELGMLKLFCVAQDGRQWQLEFDLRKAAQETSRKL